MQELQPITTHSHAGARSQEETLPVSHSYSESSNYPFFRLAAKGFGACQHMSITVNLESEANYINPTKYDSYSFPYLTKHYFIKNDRWASSFFKTLPKGKTDPSTLTHSTPLVQSRPLNKLWNLGQTSAWFCLAKGENYMKTALTNPNVTTKSRRQKSPLRSKDLLGLQTFDW